MAAPALSPPLRAGAVFNRPNEKPGRAERRKPANDSWRVSVFSRVESIPRLVGCNGTVVNGTSSADAACRAGAQGEIEVNDFNRRQTDTSVLMLLKTSKLMAEYAARRLRL